MISKRESLFLCSWAVIIILCLSFYLIAYYPGAMSSDSISQWSQMIEFRFNNWHPIISSLFYYICTRVWYSPASVVVAHIFILTAIFLSGVYVLIRMNISKVIISICLIVFALYPANGLMAINLWKDVMYSYMLLWMTIILLQIVYSKGNWLNSNVHKAFFIVNSLGVLLFRHNGMLTFIAVMLALVVGYRKYIKTNVILTSIILITYFIVSGPIYTALGNVKRDNFESFGIPMQQVAAVIKYDGVMTDEQKEFFNKILPLEVWKSEYHPLVTDYLKFNTNFNMEFAVEHKMDFIKNWANVVINNPKIALEAYLNQTSIVWKFVSWTNLPQRIIIDNNLGLGNTMISYKLTGLANAIFDFTKKNDTCLVVFWRPAIWLYSSIAAGIIIALYRGRKYLLLLVPILSNALAFMLATPAQDYRYQYVNFLIAALLIPLAVHLLFFNKNDIAKNIKDN
jgi:hypothetical protein